MQTQRGFLQLVVIIVIVLIVVGYFGLNIREILSSPTVQDNLSYGWALAKNIWQNYLAGPATWVYEHILKFLWQLFLDGVGNFRDGETATSLMQQ